MMEPQDKTEQQPVDDRAKLAFGGGSVAEGWEAVEELLKHANIGSFLRLGNGEEANITFVTAPISYIVHRKPKLDENGKIVKDSEGRTQNTLKACGHIYNGVDGNPAPCKDCDDGVPTNTRTAAGIATLKANKTNTGLELASMTVLEGGPKLWKSQIVPVIREHGPDHVFTIKRFGMGLSTTYSFINRKAGRSPSVIEALKTAEIPNLLDIIKLVDETDEIPF